MTAEGDWSLDAAAAEFYEERFVASIFGHWAPRLVAAAGVTAGDKVLDVGCGTGVAARAALDVVGTEGSVHGLDLDPNMLAVAQRKAPNIEWHEGDAARLPFEDGLFDVALSQAAFMFFPNRPAVLRDLVRVVRPGGRIALLVWGPSAGYEAAANALEGIAGEAAAETFRAPFAMADPEAFSELFAEVGLEARITVEEGSARFSSLRDFAETEISGWVLAGKVDVDAFLAAAAERLRPYVLAGGAVEIPMQALIGLAVT